MLFHAFQFTLDLIQDVLAYQQVFYQGKAEPVLLPGPSPQPAHCRCRTPGLASSAISCRWWSSAGVQKQDRGLPGGLLESLGQAAHHLAAALLINGSCSQIRTLRQLSVKHFRH